MFAFRIRVFNAICLVAFRIPQICMPMKFCTWNAFACVLLFYPVVKSSYGYYKHRTKMLILNPMYSSNENRPIERLKSARFSMPELLLANANIKEDQKARIFKPYNVIYFMLLKLNSKLTANLFPFSSRTI